MIIALCCMQLFPWVEWFSVFIEWRCNQISWYFCLCCLHSTKLCIHSHFHILILLHQIRFWNLGNCNHLVHCQWHLFVPCWIHYLLHVNWTLHAMAYLSEGSASVGWKQGLQLIQSGDSIFETEDLKVTEGFLQDKEIFNLVSITLVLLHFVLWVVQQTCTNLSPGQMRYLTQSWFNP